MTVQDLVKTCDTAKIAAIWNLRRPDYEPPFDEEKLALKLSEFCNRLSNIEISINENIILAMPCREDGEWFVRANMYKKSEMIKKVSKIHHLTFPKYSLEDSLDTLKNLSNSVFDYFPQSYGYEFDKWSNSLSSEVIPDNFNRIGKDEFIADILYELSFNGMAEDAQIERREELQKAIDESKEIQKLPPEEQEKYYISWDDLKKDFEEKFGVLDQRTQEEQDEEMRQMWVDSIETYHAQYIELKKIQEIL